MKIFVTGGAGYIGSTLVPYLISKGHEVTVLDRFFFGTEPLESQRLGDRLALIRGDTRYFSGELLKGHDAVVDMAALSNDPAGELDPWKTFEINFLGRSRVARLAREAGVKHYLLVSSCSIYGFQDGILTEESLVNPLTAYAKANYCAEMDNLPLGSDSFTTSAVRFATAYGLSRRMRFDIAINGMVLGAFKNKKIPIMRDGSQWRPFVHVKDASRAVLMVLEAEVTKVNRELFNIGGETQNYQIQALAEKVAKAMKVRPDIEWYGDPDKRSYRVSFEKAKNVLGFEPLTTPEDAVREIEMALESGAVKDDISTKTVEWYKHLLQDPQAAKNVTFAGSII